MNTTKINEKKDLVKGKLIVGVDLAQGKNFATFYHERFLGKPFPFENNQQAYIQFCETIERKRQQLGLSEIVVAMEPTAQYWVSLCRFLGERGVTTVLVQGGVVSKSRSFLDLNLSKNDSRDAYVIAELASRGSFCFSRECDSVFVDLRQLSRLRDDLVYKRSRIKNQIAALLEANWPERKSLFVDKFLKTSLSLLRCAPFPDDILKKTPEELCQMEILGSKKKLGPKKAQAVLESARTSIGTSFSLRADKIILRQRLEEYDFNEAAREEIEKEILRLATGTQYFASLTSIQGLSPLGASLLLAEMGDLRTFGRPRELTKFAGLNLIDNQSGAIELRGIKISKSGSRPLRHQLFNCCVNLIHHNPDFRLRYLEKRLKDKPHFSVMVSLMDKLLRVAFAICSKSEFYLSPIDSEGRLAEREAEWARSRPRDVKMAA